MSLARSVGVAALAFAASACDQGRESADAVVQNPESVIAQDSSRAVNLALDSIPFGVHRGRVRVVTFYQDPDGYLIRLVVPADVRGAGALVWVDRAGAVVTLKVHQ